MCSKVVPAWGSGEKVVRDPIRVRHDVGSVEAFKHGSGKVQLGSVPTSRTAHFRPPCNRSLRKCHVSDQIVGEIGNVFSVSSLSNILSCYASRSLLLADGFRKYLVVLPRRHKVVSTTLLLLFSHVMASQKASSSYPASKQPRPEILESIESVSHGAVPFDGLLSRSALSLMHPISPGASQRELTRLC